MGVCVRVLVQRVFVCWRDRSISADILPLCCRFRLVFFWSDDLFTAHPPSSSLLIRFTRRLSRVSFSREVAIFRVGAVQRLGRNYRLCRLYGKPITPVTMHSLREMLRAGVAGGALLARVLGVCRRLALALGTTERLQGKKNG